MFPAFLTAPAKQGAAVLGSHAFSETVSSLAFDIGFIGQRLFHGSLVKKISFKVNSANVGL